MTTGNEAARAPHGNSKKFLSFCLGREHYGVEILRVREIIGLIAITPLPRAPSYVKGVANLHGRIIPVIDLRAKLGIPGAEPTRETCIIVLDNGEGDSAAMGIVVDSVCEVQDIERESIEPAPAFADAIPPDYIEGIGKVNDRMVILLNIAGVLSAVGPRAAPETERSRRAA